MGQFQYAGEGVNSTTIQCVHEQSLTGICIFPLFLFASNGSPMYKSLTKTKKYSELEANETLKRVASANAIIKHYKSSSKISVKHHAMVLSFLKANLVVIYVNYLFCSIRACTIRKLRKYWPQIDRVLTPQ